MTGRKEKKNKRRQEKERKKEEDGDERVLVRISEEIKRNKEDIKE